MYYNRWKSGFQVIRQIGLLKIFISILLILGCMEVVSRIAPHLVSKCVHQRFGHSQRISQVDWSNYGEPIVWRSNENGARGGLYQGQPVRIAVFGSSTSIDSLLSQDQCWSESLRCSLGESMVHVDNYARDAAGAAEALHILKDLEKKQIHYDVVLIMAMIGQSVNIVTTDTTCYHYWSSWSAQGPLKFPGILRKRAKKQVQQEPFLNRIDRYVQENWLHPDVDRTPIREKRRLRNEGLVQLHDVERKKWTDADIQKREAMISKLLTTAKNVSEHCFVVTQPVAYDQEELPGVSRRWGSLYPIKGTPGCYKNNRSVAEGIRIENTFFAEQAPVYGVDVIDLDRYIRPLLRQRDDLFEDKWHFSPEGCSVAADYIASQISPVILRKMNEK
ncbi:MAG: hypothetical protein ACYSUG_04550 [Planctomycetota bacterium]